ncbi:polymorphic toxin-type HINT domain-containing protein [Streptomyces sp. NPDC059398]|uniref:polymorphic toxin-type HINT domain-containing protein n=1 Tax=Streptomyces sp. NPDC059398 TaxID=3346820 RepID=UPI0036BB6937
MTKPVKAGTLPVWVSSAPAARHPSRASGVRIQVASHAKALRAGANGMLLGFTRAGAMTDSDRIRVVIDYNQLAKAYGGGFGSRLQLMRVPACALTTPQLAECQTRTPLGFTNRAGAGQLTATIPVGSPKADATSRGLSASAMSADTATTALAVTSGSSGSQGNYGATSLNPSGTWQASGTGSFTYSYPIAVPAAIGGNAPTVGLSYDSQSVDGETSARNSQSGWLGDGWSYQPGSIERSYRPCGSLLDSSGNKIAKGSGDECWGGDNATISFGSHSGVLVPTTSSGVPGEIQEWKLQGDDGTLVQELSGAANGLHDGVYYRVLTTDGAAAYFGADHAPTGPGTSGLAQSSSPTDASTHSAWSVPVLHPQSSDPCYTSAKGKASQCDKPEGWRWNLDFAVTPTGFVQRYDYTTETNYYDLGAGQAATGDDGTLSSYTRGGTLASIAYGYTLDDEKAGHTPAGEVDFTSSQRCKATSSFTDCSAGNLKDSTAPHWPDVPYDQNCDASDSTHLPAGSTSIPENVCFDAGPSFWSTTRLDTITTKVHVKDSGTDKLLPVDSYKLGQTYSDAGGSVDPVTGTTVDPKDAGSLQAVMWLQSITHTGKGTYNNGNSDLTLNQVSFTGTEIDNRVNDVSPSAPPLYRPRISTVQTETGEGIAVDYNLNPCAGKTLSIKAADSNTNSCYPVYWTVPGASKPIADWFNKTTVHTVNVSDLTIASQYNPNTSKIPAGSESQLSTYSYTGAAWHRDDSVQTDDEYRTWDQFRGFRTVTVETGKAPEPVTRQTTTYLQGMDGDYQADKSTRRSVSVDAKVGGNTVESVTDANQLAGLVLEADNYTAAGGTVNAVNVNGPFAFTATETAVQHPWSAWTQDDNPGETKQPLSTLPDLTAHRPRSTQAHSYELLANGTWRHSRTDTNYDAQGRVATVDAHGDVSTPSQETCATTAYAAPPANTVMLDYPDQVTVVSGACGTAVTPTTLLSDKKIYYKGSYTGDGVLTNLGAFGQTSASGQVTQTQIASGYTGTTENWQTTAAMKYDGAGRITDAANAAGQNTHTDFTPAWSAGRSNTNATSTASLNTKNWKVTSTVDPLRGLPLENVDANGRKTDMTYDALGRRTAVWLPGRDKAGGQSADKTFAYSINPGAVAAPGGTITQPGAPTSVTTKTLREDGSYSTDISIYDGMLQPRQTQSTANGDVAAGRIISDTFYDSHGWPSASYAPYSEPTGDPSTALFAANENEIPSETTTSYDGQGRSLASTLWHQAVKQWSTTTSYPGADETDTTAPAGGRSTATFTNALGQKTRSVVKNTGSTVILTGGQVIPSGTSLTSSSVRLTMQGDGNLVFSALATGATIWSSATSGNPGAYAKFGTDGNLVIYSTAGAVLMSTNIAPTVGSTLRLRTTSTLVIVAANATTILWQKGKSGAVPAADATTSYTYTPAGGVSTIKDNAGNAWSYSYNLLGQKTTQSDPNTGTTTFDKYDVAGNLLQSTDPRGQKLSYAYDWDNRKTAEYAGAWSSSPDASTQLGAWTYDTPAKGYPTSSTRYVGGSGSSGKAYTQAVTGYNTAYQPTGSTVTVPAADGFAAAGQNTAPSSGNVTYTNTAAYTPNTGKLSTTHYQADGNLPAEDVDYGYTQQGNLDSFGGYINAANTPAYLDIAVHDPFGRIKQANYGSVGKETATFAQYDDTTGSVTQTSSMMQTQSNAVDVVNYRYNRAGDITAIDDLQDNTTHDTQCFAYDSFQRLTEAWTDTAGITSPTSSPVGSVGGCTTSRVQTNGATPVTTSTVGGPAAYWQSYTYDQLGDRTGMVNHDTTGNALNDTTQTVAYTGTDSTTAATLPNQAGATTTSNPATGTTTQTPTYTDPSHNNANAGDTITRKNVSSGPLRTGFALTGGGTLCMDDAGGAVTPGTVVRTYACNATIGQNWTIGTDGTVKVKGACLDTTGNATAAGTHVVLDTCGADATQKWKVTTGGTLVSSANTAMCLTDPGASANVRTQLTLATCGSAGQKWNNATTGAIPAGQIQSVTYDAEGRTATVTTPTGATTNTSKYLYDANGQLLEQTSAVGSADKTRVLYLFGGTEQITLNVTAKTWTGLRNYTGPDSTTITRTSTGSVTYQIANAQGTATTAVNASTSAVTRRAFDPYGNARGTQPTSWVSADENRGFLGQPTDTTTGLNLLGARNYDATTGRFLSPDPVFEAGDPNQMGGYTYSGDNPTTSSDPSGLLQMYTPAGSGVGATGGPEGNGWEPPCTQVYDACVGSPHYTPPSNSHGWGYAKRLFKDTTESIATAAVVSVVVIAVGGCAVESGGLASPACAAGGASAFTTVCGSLFGDCGSGAEDDPIGEVGRDDRPHGETADAGGAAGAGKEAAAGAAKSDGKAPAASRPADSQEHAKAATSEAAASDGPATGASGTDAPPQCFLAGTKVLMADGSKENIEKIKVGDKVQATDPETGKSAKRKVTALIITEGYKHFDELTIKTKHGKAKLTATSTHPFWSPSAHHWIQAGTLKPGMTLLARDGSTVAVQAKHQFSKHARTYNLTIAQLHTYYVVAGTTPVLVHNTCGGSDLRVAVGKGASRDYQMSTTGMIEVRLHGGGERIWADGVEGDSILDAKFVSGKSSPFIPPGIKNARVQGFIDADIGNEMRRYAAVIDDSGNPYTNLRIITNSSSAVPYFEGMMSKYGVPGTVSVVP